MTKTELLALADALEQIINGKYQTPVAKFIADTNKAAAALREYAGILDAEPWQSGYETGCKGAWEAMRLADEQMPPSPQRLPLTDEEIEYIKDQYLEYNGLDEFDRYTYTTERADGVLDFARAVLEAAHGIGSTK